MDKPDPAPLIGPAGYPGAVRAHAAGCWTFVFGLVVSWAAAQWATRGRPDRTEVSDALYWDGVYGGWCCGGVALSAAVAVVVGVVTTHRAYHRAMRDRPPTDTAPR